MNNPLRFTDPTGHRCVEEGFEGSCASVEKKMTIKWKANNKKRKEDALWRAELRELLASTSIGGPCLSVVCITNSGSEFDIPLDPRLQHMQSASPGFSGEFDNLISQIEFGVEALHLLDLVENGMQWGRPTYRQIKYVIPLGGLEWGVDAGLQMYDDRNLHLSMADRVGRAIIRGAESAAIDGASTGLGLLAAAALQASVPVPLVSAGVGYVVGSYSTSAILDNFASQMNSALFNLAGLGGP